MKQLLRNSGPFLAAFLVILLFRGTGRAEDLSAWPHSAVILFNTTPAGAGITAPVKDFPVLVRLAGPSRIFEEARADGADVRFVDADGTPLNHQVERWDKAGMKAEFWVKVPQIDGASDKDFIKCYWGNPAAIMASDGSKVFPAENGFAGAWHLGEGGVQARANSVGTGNHATPVNFTGNERTSGVIGYADSLNGAPAGAYLDLGKGFGDMSKGFTYSGWVFSSGLGLWERIFDLGNGEGIDNIVLSRQDSSNGLSFVTMAGTAGNSIQVLPGSIEANAWMHVAVTYSGQEVAIYKNGAKGLSAKNGYFLPNVVRTRNYLGHSNWHADGYFHGKIDEPEISLVSRTPDWIKLSYETQKPGSRVLSFEFLQDSIPAEPEDYSRWNFKRTVTFNTTSTGAVISGPVAGFPMLLRFVKGTLDFTQFMAGGKDIRFADKDGTHLPFEIERWDPVLSEAEIWVRVPLVKSNTAADFVTMYWGNGLAPAGAARGSVFRPQDGFAGVWHFDEKDGDAVDAISGSGTGSVAGATRDVAGIIGGAFRFAGGSDHVGIPASLTKGRTAFTISMWAREIGSGGGTGPTYIFYPTLFGMESPGASSGDFGLVSLSGKAAFWSGLRAGGDLGVTYNAAINDGKWHHLALTYTGNSMSLYENGVSLGSMTADNYAVSDSGFAIGCAHWSDGTFQYGFTGDIDAVQLSGVARSADWIKLAHETQKEGSKAVALGPVTSQKLVEPTVAAPTADPPGGPYNDPQSVRLTSATAGAAIYYTLDGSEPDPAKSTTALYGPPILIRKTSVLNARAYADGIGSDILSTAYTLVINPVASGDTLKAGGTVNLDAGHWIDYPAQDAQAPVVVSAGPAWNPPPAGFDKVGSRFRIAATDTRSVFPGLMLSSSLDMASLSLYRLEENGAILWMPRSGQKLMIPMAGDYFWARDTLAPKVSLAGKSLFGGDSAHVTYAIEDNVANPQVMFHIWNGVHDSLGWWAATAGDTVGFSFPFGTDRQSPAEIRFLATDHAQIVSYPPGAATALTLGRDLPAFQSPIAIPSGLEWKLVGMPINTQDPITLSSLAEGSGTNGLIGALWKTGPGTEAGYAFIEDDDALPMGKGFWLASKAATPNLAFPASRTFSSDTDGLFPIHLIHGWNMVTCPGFRPLAWPISRSDGDAYRSSSFQTLIGFDGKAYAVLDTLRPWEGYYVHYSGTDTVLRIGPGSGRAFPENGVSAPKAASGGWMEITLDPGHGIPLKIGADAIAREGVGREDEMSPPQRMEGGIRIDRDGHALVGDFVPMEKGAAMAWTLVANGRQEIDRLTVRNASLPEGWQAWAVSPARRLKYRLEEGGSLPVTEGDTLLVYAGTTEALSGVGDLIRGVESAGPFRCALRAAAGSFVLSVILPEAARLEVRIWTSDGRCLGRMVEGVSGAGTHTWKAGELMGKNGAVAPGVYLIEVTAEGRNGSGGTGSGRTGSGRTWSGHRILKASALP
ncbi:MAG: LamG domain protein jellyroll fold domain protein [Fibrobacteres bacterium]|nr:LamG domain protein jellyroll fold domain protein [Fibrobacterota bacterium]